MSWFSPSQKDTRATSTRPKNDSELIVKKHNLTPYVLGGFLTTSHNADHNASVSKFLLTSSQFMFLHKNNRSDQVFHFYSGDPLILVILDKSKQQDSTFATLDSANCQVTVRRNSWFGAYCGGSIADSGSSSGYSFVAITNLPNCDPDFDVDFAHAPSLMKQVSLMATNIMATSTTNTPQYKKATPAIEKLTQNSESVLTNYEAVKISNKRKNRARSESFTTASSPRRSSKTGTSPPTILEHPEFRSTFEKPRQLAISLALFAMILYLGDFKDIDTSSPKSAFRLSLLMVFLAFEVSERSEQQV